MSGTKGQNGQSTVSYSTKELFEQIRQSLKDIVAKLDGKAEAAVVASLMRGVEERAKQAAVDDVVSRVTKLENEMITKEAVEKSNAAFVADSKKTRLWVIGLAISSIISIAGLIVTILYHVRM